MPKPSVKDALITGACRIFHERGYSQATIQLIAEAAGAPKGSFINHFRDKEELAIAALERYAIEETEVMRRALEAPGRSAAERVRDMFVALARRREGEPFCGCLMGNLAAESSSNSDAIRLRLGSLYAATVAPLAVVIAEGQAAKQISRRLTADTLAEVLFNAWEGTLLRVKVDRDARAVDAFLRVLDTLLLPD